jgi:hypothetical protein
LLFIHSSLLFIEFLNYRLFIRLTSSLPGLLPGITQMTIHMKKSFRFLDIADFQQCFSLQKFGKVKPTGRQINFLPTGKQLI